MRVLSSLLMLLGVATGGVAAQAVLDGSLASGTGTSFTYWKFVGNADTNPAVNVTAGTGFTFDISQITDTHPFVFSTNGVKDQGPQNGAALDPLLYTVSASAGCTATPTTGQSTQYTTTANTGAATQAGTCVITLLANQTAINETQTIYYRCGLHQAMVGTITVFANTTTTPAATTVPPTTTPPTSPPGNNGTNGTSSTTVPPTTLPPTTNPPTNGTGGNGTTGTTSPPTNPTATTVPPTTGPITGATLTGTSFRIVGANATTGYIFLDGGKEYLNPTLSISSNITLTISLEFPTTPLPHPFALSPSGDITSVTADKNFFPDDLNKDTKNTTTACTKSVPSINAFTTATTGSPCVITIPVPADAAGQNVYYRCAFHKAMVGLISVKGSTPAPTQPPKNSASIVGAGIAFVIAAITALFA